MIYVVSDDPQNVGWQVQLDSWPDTMNALQFDDVASSPSNRGDGFAFVNNTIGNLRGRGILSK